MKIKVLKKDVQRCFMYHHSSLGLIRAFYYPLDTLDKKPWTLIIDGNLTCYSKSSELTSILNKINFF